jgi:SOS-response transcriptional repressor LexA
METISVNPNQQEFVYSWKRNNQGGYRVPLFSDRLIERMKERGERQIDLVTATGATKGAVSKWINQNAIPDARYLMPLARFLGVTPAWLTTGRLPKEPQGAQEEPLRRVPIISSIDAGNWCSGYAKEYLDKHTEFQVTTLNDISEQAFALRVKGDSMVNPHAMPSLPDGAMVVVDPAVSAGSGDIVVAQMRGGDEAVIKRLVIDGPMRYLAPLNPKYPTIAIDADCRIVGRVRQVIQTL